MAASYEARRRGVRGAMDGARARRLCPDAVVVPPRVLAPTSQASDELFELFRDTRAGGRGPVARGGVPRRPRARADLGHAASRSPRACAGEARERVGLPVTVGIARTKTLAKMASRAAKPDGLLLVAPERERAFLHPLAVESALGRRRSRPLGSCARPGSRPSASSPQLLGAGARDDRRPRRRPPPARGRPQPRPAPGARRAPPALVRLAVGARALVGLAPRRSTRWSSRSPTGSPGGCGPRRASAARSSVRLRFGDFTPRDAARGRMPTADRGDQRDPAPPHERSLAEAMPVIRAPRPDPDRAHDHQPRARPARASSSSCRRATAAATASTRRSTSCATASASARSPARRCSGSGDARRRRGCGPTASATRPLLRRRRSG